MTEMSYFAMKNSAIARESDALRNEEKKRSLLMLVIQYLENEGYINSHDILLSESNMTDCPFEVCDNVDLDTILMEYQSYYYVKFSKYPKIIRKCARAGKNNSTSLPSKPVKTSIKQKPSLPKVENPKNHEDLNIVGTTAKAKTIIDCRQIINNINKLTPEDLENINHNNKILKPFPNFTGEWRELTSVISRDIFIENPNVHWDDIIGLQTAKRLIKEAVVYPIKYPELFSGILSPWKGLLLYGPPGTGKTMLAKAVATECGTTFFNISASTIVSKWRGDSEKLVKVLFEMARFYAPSTIFLDEIDSILGQRGSSHGSSTEHEASRRMKTELLMEMDGLAKSNDLVFLLCASNLPWELDHAMLRRLDKRIFVELPVAEARKYLFSHFLPPSNKLGRDGLNIRAEIDYNLAASRTDGYSGSDIHLVCKEAAMMSVRKIFKKLEENNFHSSELIGQLDPIKTEDVITALASTKPSSKQFSAEYSQWQKDFESV